MKKEAISFVKTLFWALLFAGVIRSLWFEPFHIPSSSMKPNLLIGDYIIVSKYSYGYSRYSFPFGFKFFEGRVGLQNRPERGDVVVFRYPPDPSINYIKRVVGLPGDEIQMRDGVVFVNNEPIEKVANGFFVENEVKIAQFVEKIGQKQVKVLDAVEDSSADNTGIYRVPQGYYFMMGDNRDNSQDSRFLSAVGYVAEENLVGKARFMFFSVNRPIWQFWNWYKSIRFSRILKKID